MKDKYHVIKSPEVPNEVLAPFKGKTIWNPGIVYTPYVPLMVTEPLKRTVLKFKDWLKARGPSEIIAIESMEQMKKLYKIDKLYTVEKIYNEKRRI